MKSISCVSLVDPIHFTILLIQYLMLPLYTVNIIYRKALSNISCTVGQHKQPRQRSMNPPNYFQKRLLITVLLLTVLPLTPFFIVWTECRSGIFPFLLCFGSRWLLASCGFAFWLCFWLLLVLASVFWPFSIKQRTSKVNECFFDFSICSFYSLHFPTTPHMSYLSTCSRISRYVSAIYLDNFTNIVHLAPFPRFSFSISFLDMFMPTFAEYSNMRASYIQLKGTAAQSTRAWNILAKSKEHSVNQRKHDIGTKNL